MPVLKPKKKMKRKPNPVDQEKVKLGQSAAEAVLAITSDTSKDWELQDIKAEAERRRMVPPRVYQEAVPKAITAWLSDGARRAKKPFGGGTRPKKVRVLGVYGVKEQTPDGEVDRLCWRAWELMDRDQREDAIHRLYKNGRRCIQEAENARSYCSQLEVGSGRAPILKSDVLARD